MLQELVNGEDWQEDVGLAEAAIRLAHRSKDDTALVAGESSLHYAEQALRSERGQGDIPPPAQINRLEDPDSLGDSIGCPPRQVVALEYQTPGTEPCTHPLTHSLTCDSTRMCLRFLRRAQRLSQEHVGRPLPQEC